MGTNAYVLVRTQAPTPSQPIATATTLPTPITTAATITTTIIAIRTTMASIHAGENAKMAETQETTIRTTRETRFNNSITHGASHATKLSVAIQDTN
jgi:hypothetical protein